MTLALGGRASLYIRVAKHQLCLEVRVARLALTGRASLYTKCASEVSSAVQCVASQGCNRAWLRRCY